MKKLVILGAGTAGTVMATKMRRRLPAKEWDITIIDKKSVHYYQPGLIFIPFQLFGYNGEKGNARPIEEFIPTGVNFVKSEVQAIDPEKRKVKTKAGSFDYDYLVISLGCDIYPDEIEGMSEGYNKNVYYFYTMKSALDLQKAIAGFEKGKLVIDIAENPIKCPVAPIEFASLADYYFRLKGIRDQVEIEVVTNMSGVFTKPIAGKIFTEMFERKGIKMKPDFQIASVDHQKKKITSWTKEEMDYDLLVAIPPNLGQSFIDDSGLGNGAGYVVTDQGTLKHAKYPNIYALGDITSVATSKAGSVAHFEASIVEANLMREIQGKEPIETFDGHSLCYVESGYKKAHLIDFNYKQEPTPGHLPIPGIGPFALLKETRANHWGKLFFRWYYWNLLLKDRLAPVMDLILPTKMSLIGKDKRYLKQ
ncbi:MAG: FAD/NAD(P)-binding oxidoreductase [Leptospirales bacterium]